MYHNRLFTGATTPRALLIWERLDSTTSLNYHGATHVVYFRIFGDAPNCAGHLAGLLLRLVSAETHNVSPARRVRLKKLIYSIKPSAVFGTAYFAGLDNAYDRAEAFATAHPYYRFTPSATQTNLPVTTWPDATKAFADTMILLDAFETIM